MIRNILKIFIKIDNLKFKNGFLTQYTAAAMISFDTRKQEKNML
jgi:hypothetical protein